MLVKSFADELAWKVQRQLIKQTNSEVHTMHFRKLNNEGENFLTEVEYITTTGHIFNLFSTCSNVKITFKRPYRLIEGI